MHPFFEKLAFFVSLLLYHQLETSLLLQALMFLVLADSIHLFLRINLLSKFSVHSILKFQRFTKRDIWGGSDCRVINCG